MRLRSLTSIVLSFFSLTSAAAADEVARAMSSNSDSSAGLSVEETAAALGVSRLTVIRDWNFARVWLQAEMSGKNLE